MMFSSSLLLIGVAAACWSILTYFFGMRRVKQASSYLEVAMIALVVFLVQVLPVAFYGIFSMGVFSYISMGALSGSAFMLLASLVVVPAITTYLTVFGILASCYYVFSEPDGEL